MKKSYWNFTALAAALSIAVCSCSSGKTSGNDKSSGSDSSPQISGDPVTEERSVQTANEVLSDSYKSTPISIPENINWISSVTPIKEKNIILAVGSSYGGGDAVNTNIYSFSEDFSSYNIIKLEFPPEYSAADISYLQYYFYPGGDIGVLLTLVDCGGVKLPEEYDENFDYDAYNANQTSSYMYCKYDVTGKLLTSTPITGMDVYKDEYNVVNISAIAEYQGKTMICLNDATVLALNGDGSVSELYTPELEENDDIYRSELLYDADGRLILIENGIIGQEMNEIYLFYEFNADDGSVGEPILKLQEEGSGTVVSLAGAITTGGGDHRLLIPQYDALYGLKADGSLEKIIDWLDSDTTASTVNCVGEDKYTVYGTDSLTNKPFFSLLTRRPMSEVENTQIITMAAIYGIQGGDTYVNSFNKSQSKYRIKFVDYSQYNDDYTGDGAMQQLQLDIIAGKAPDIIVTSDLNTITSLSSKGAFADLYEFMENDSGVNRDTLMPNVLNALESPDGKLYTISPSFGVATIAAKKNICDKENWTLDDMISLYDNAPATADHLYDYRTKTDVFTDLLRASSDFVDYEKASCRFDSDDFVNLLEFCNRYVEEIEMPDKETEPEAHGQYYYDQFMAWSQDRELIRTMSPAGQNGYSYTRYVQARDEIALVGFPSANEKGGKLTFDTYYAISNTCPAKEGAWEFLRSYFTPENQEIINYGSTPVLKSAFEKQMDSTMHFTDWDGKPVESIEDDGAEYYPLTQEQRDMVAEYIMNCDTIYGVMDPDIYDICMEEAGSFFSGECSAKQAADMIQSRVSILLSERS